jgi:hypothetical protein
MVPTPYTCEVGMKGLDYSTILHVLMDRYNLGRWEAARTIEDCGLRAFATSVEALIRHLELMEESGAQ